MSDEQTTCSVCEKEIEEADTVEVVSFPGGHEQMEVFCVHCYNNKLGRTDWSVLRCGSRCVYHWQPPHARSRDG